MSTSIEPAHNRLDEFKHKHLVALLRHLRGGNLGVDPARHPTVCTKDAIVATIRAEFTAEQIDAAHCAVVASYPHGYGYRSRRGANSGNGSSEPIAVDPSEPVIPATVATPTAPIAQPASMPSAPAMPAGGVDLLGGFAQLIAQLVSQQVQQQTAALEAQLSERIAAAVAAANHGVTLVKLQQPNNPEPINLGIQHRNFPKLLKMCSARLRSGHRINIWLHGPAGTGKTTAAEKVAEALGLQFTYNGALDTRYDLLGFRTANGEVVRTPFREAWENGGVYLFDEIDASSQSALLALNGALANGLCPFPDGVIPRHPDCVILAGANTTGLGATIEYVGRMKQDASLLDRFVFLDWPLDEGLEDALCADKSWLNTVRRVRERSRTVKGAMVTPRASLFGEALIAAGLDRETVETAVLRKGMSADDWARVRG